MHTQTRANTHTQTNIQLSREKCPSPVLAADLMITQTLSFLSVPLVFFLLIFDLITDCLVPYPAPSTLTISDPPKAKLCPLSTLPKWPLYLPSPVYMHSRTPSLFHGARHPHHGPMNPISRIPLGLCVGPAVNCQTLYFLNLARVGVQWLSVSNPPDLCHTSYSPFAYSFPIFQIPSFLVIYSY